MAEVITDGSIESLEQYLDIDKLPDPEAEGMEGCKAKVVTYCGKCDRSVCIDHFEEYHTKSYIFYARTVDYLLPKISISDISCQKTTYGRKKLVSNAYVYESHLSSVFFLKKYNKKLRFLL